MAKSKETNAEKSEFHQDYPSHNLRTCAAKLNILADAFSNGIGRSDAQHCYLREAIAVVENAAVVLRGKASEWGVTI
jgi:hypothetical protein